MSRKLFFAFATSIALTSALTGHANAAESTLDIKLNIDLSPAMNEMNKVLGQGINERLVPLGTDLHGVRFDFRSHPGRPPEYKITPEGAISIVAHYYGDLEHLGVPPCGLGSSPGNYDARKRWVYLDLSISGRPVVIRQGSDWFLALDKPQGGPAIALGSDTKACFINIDVSGLLRAASEAAEAAVGNALAQARFQLKVGDLAKDLSGPIEGNIAPLGLKACMYPNVKKITIGRVSGQMPNVSLATRITAEPSLSLVRSCAPASVAIPDIVTE